MALVEVDDEKVRSREVLFTSAELETFVDDDVLADELKRKSPHMEDDEDPSWNALEADEVVETDGCRGLDEKDENDMLMVSFMSSSS